MKMVNLRIGDMLRVRQMGVTVELLIEDITLFTWGDDLRVSVEIIHRVTNGDGVSTEQGMNVVGTQLAYWLKDGDWEIVHA